VAESVNKIVELVGICTRLDGRSTADDGMGVVI
jgi:hypothetical protein